MSQSKTSKSILLKFAKQLKLRPVNDSHALERTSDRQPR